MVDEIRQRRPGLQNHVAGVALRIVASAHGAALVEDLRLDAVEGAGVEHGRIAHVRVGKARHLDLVFVLVDVPADQLRDGGDLELLLGLLTHAVERSSDRDVERRRIGALVGDRRRRTDVVVHPIRHRLKLGIELGIAVVERVIDVDALHAVQGAIRAVGAVGAGGDLELADAVHDAVGVTTRVAVGAAA